DGSRRHVLQRPELGVCGTGRPVLGLPVVERPVVGVAVLVGPVLGLAVVVGLLPGRRGARRPELGLELHGRLMRHVERRRLRWPPALTLSGDLTTSSPKGGCRKGGMGHTLTMGLRSPTCGPAQRARKEIPTAA